MCEENDLQFRALPNCMNMRPQKRETERVKQMNKFGLARNHQDSHVNWPLDMDKNSAACKQENGMLDASSKEKIKA